eukprot:scaffold319_cov97-Cylindrotheca_fusiformis.AAC.4
MSGAANSSFTASYNRKRDWVNCCRLAQGFEWVDRFDQEETSRGGPRINHESPIIQITNMLGDEYFADDDYAEEESKQDIDQWTENALRIQADLTRMAEWIQNKQHDYISLDMGDEEASLIQSTVTSFAATTASELETLRKIIPSSSSNIANHRSGIVQIILSQLQSSITEPFGKLQRQRSRIAVNIWQNPQQCKLYRPKQNSRKSRSMVELLDEEDDTEREQRFLPRKGRPLDDYDFMTKYTEAREERKLPSRPSFLAHFDAALKKDLSLSTTEKESPRGADPTKYVPQKKVEKPEVMPYQQQTTEESRRQLEEDLQQETVMLTMAAQNDLDSVQKMEQRMVEITTLIGQFSNLVGEQQEEIIHIHDSAKESKENMDKGQENLIDARERQKKSKHWLAWIIFSMSMTLLFFHTLRN